jgi:pimeloyl-ACP methyl ester carboxylesterase
VQQLPFASTHIAYSDNQAGGPPILLLHGFCEDSYIWKDVRPELEARNYRVIAIDLPGFGSSGVLPGARIDDYADAVEAVASHLDLPPFLLVGHSMGGYTGLNYLRRFPHRLLGFSLLHSHPWPDSEDRKQGRLRGIEDIRNTGHVLFVKQLIPRFFAPAFAKNQPFAVDALVHRAAQGRSEGIIVALQAMMHRADESDTLRQSRVPVQFILGKQDPLFDWDDMLAQTHLPSIADIQILDNVGHMGMLEAPRYVRQHLSHFAGFCSSRSGT